jgi:hypothetical protein
LSTILPSCEIGGAVGQGQRGSFLASADHRILKRHALGVIFRESFFCRLFAGKDLEVSTSPTCLLVLT